MGWHGPCKVGSRSRYEETGSFTAELYDGLAAAIFLSTPNTFEVVPTESELDRRWILGLRRR